MKHQTLEQLQTHAEIRTHQPYPAMSRAKRLERWAELLEREPKRLLYALAGTEYAPIDERNTMRADGSPLTVAFDDPDFRAEGLKNDSYGEARRFFDITDQQLHNIVCHCHFGKTIKAASAARRVRWSIGLFARMRNAIFG